MANSDYETRGSGTICPSATISVRLLPGDLEMQIAGYTSASSGLPSVGQGVMVDGEIMRVTSVALPSIGVARGCADTIPAEHELGKRAWFFTDDTGSDEREYMATETIGTKVLMRSSTSTMDVQNAPPIPLTFNHRFARPYPPGKVMINDLPFWSTARLTVVAPVLHVEWAHRDRITQADTLQGQEVGNIGPEVGTTYHIQVLEPNGTVVRDVPGITGTSWDYSMADAISDLGIDLASLDALDGYVTLESVRDGFVSWQKYFISIDVDPSGIYGVQYGTSWGVNT